MRSTSRLVHGSVRSTSLWTSRMPDFLRLVATLREQMQAVVSRSDVLWVLLWPPAILALFFVNALWSDADDWVPVLLAALFVLSLLLYGGAFIYLLSRDRDALRSEKYSLQKLAIEHGMYGDSEIGLNSPQKTLPAPDTPTAAGS